MSVVAICGGIGGAKLALGLAHAVPGDALAIAVNTGDDFEHLGLHISPDVDTVTYTLAGVVNPETGWGRAGETWAFMEALKALGGETWFNLGDKDLALHVERTRRLRAGVSLSEITADLCARLGIAARVLPMSNEPVRTTVETDMGTLEFQRYFVEHKCAPALKNVRFEGVEAARLEPGIEQLLRSPELRAVILCPSNPYLSIDPVLAVPGMRKLLRETQAPVVAVSPVVDGAAVKGPMAKIMDELGVEVSHASIARHYDGLIDGLMVDAREDGIPAGIEVGEASTLMTTLDDKVALAHAVLDFAARIDRRGRSLRERTA